MRQLVMGRALDNACSPFHAQPDVACSAWVRTAALGD